MASGIFKHSYKTKRAKACRLQFITPERSGASRCMPGDRACATIFWFTM